MATHTMDPPSDSISNLSDYALYGEAIPGSNGDETGTPTYDIGIDPSDANYGYNVWDPSLAGGDTADGFHTGDQPFSIDADLDAGANSLSVDDAGAIAYDTGGSQAIGSVIVRAGTQTTGKATWTDLTISFYQGSTLADSLTLGTGPAVDTTGDDAPDQEEQILLVTPASSSTPYSRVVIAGTINMQTPAGTLPGPDDLFCQAFVFPPS